VKAPLWGIVGAETPYAEVIIVNAKMSTAASPGMVYFENLLRKQSLVDHFNEQPVIN